MGQGKLRCASGALLTDADPARLAFKSKLQIGHARHFGLASSLNSAVVISVLALYAFSWKAVNKISVPENPLC